MRFEQAADGTLHVLYDLVSDDPNAVFFVSLEVAMNEDGTFDMFPTSVSGDIGAGVTPGTDKRIVWEAGRDVERLQIDLFRFRIVTEAAAAVPTGRAGLVVASAPDGASVSIDGTVRGVTPLSLENLAPGEHRIVVNLDGYLENSQVLTIAEGDTQRVRLELTPLTEEQAAAQADSGSGGGPNLAIILPLVGGGAAAALLALSGGGDSATTPTSTSTTSVNRAPTGGSISASPTGAGIVAATEFAFTAAGVTDPDGDSITFRWDFGDGGSGQGRTVSKTYSATGTRQVRLFVKDARSSERQAATRNVTVRRLTGTWVGGLSGFTNRITLTLSQTGSSITGSFRDGSNPRRTGSGTVTDPRTISVRFPRSGFVSIVFTGTADSQINTLTGTVTGFVGGGVSFTLTRQ